MTRRKGAILVETSVAGALVAVAMIAVAQLLAVAIRQDQGLEMRRSAANQAANALEKALSQPWEATGDVELRLEPIAADDLPNGRISYNVKPLDDDSTIRRITVDVSWTNAAGQPSQVSLSAWQAQQGDSP